MHLDRLHATGALTPPPTAGRGTIRTAIVALVLLAAFIVYLIVT